LAIGEGLRKSLRLNETLRPGRLLDVTLCSLPAYRNSTAKDVYAKAAVAAVSGLRHPPTQLIFDRAERFGGGAYVLTGKNKNAIALAKTTGVLLRRAGISSRPHAPHMTLFYTHREAAPSVVKPPAWTAAEVVLIRSHGGESRYESLGAVPLAMPGQT
jgi:2'-5' RNA ligase